MLCLICAIWGCSSSTELPATASVRFAYVNRLCPANTVSLQFLIDNVVVDTMTMHDGQATSVHLTTAASHVLGAHLLSSGLSLVPDTMVTLGAGEVFTRQVVSITPEC